MNKKSTNPIITMARERLDQRILASVDRLCAIDRPSIAKSDTEAMPENIIIATHWLGNMRI
jgi:hypothetical protein